MKVCTQCKLAALCLGGAEMYFMPSYGYEPMNPEPPYERVALRVEVLSSAGGIRWEHGYGQVYALSNDCPDKRGRRVLVRGD